MNKHAIPCPHETENLPASAVVPDYHPLTIEEIVSLLRQAESEVDYHSADIQVRLNQGIPGLVCPRDIYGPTNQAQNEVNNVFVQFKRELISVEEASQKIFNCFLSMEKT